MVINITMSIKNSSTTNLPQLVTDDATATNEPHVPSLFKTIGKVVYWNQTPNFNQVNVHLEPGKEVRPGQFIGIWHGKRGKSTITILRVANTFETNPNESPELAAARNALSLGQGYSVEGLSTRIYRQAECSTVEEFEVNLDNDKIKIIGDGKAPEELCRAGDIAILLPSELIQQSFGGLENEADGLQLGTTYGSDNVDVTLSPQMFQLHTGVFGNPGKGKSYQSGVMLEEAMAWDIPCIVLDINGELVDAAEALGGLVITLPDSKAFGISLNLMTPQELVSITPNVQPNTIYAELIELAHDQLRNEARGQHITFQMLRERIERIGQMTDAKKPSIGAAIARVSTLERDPIIGGNFDFIEQMLKHRLVVLDCRYLSLRQTQLIAAAGARELQRIGREMARKAEEGDKEAQNWFALYFIDEAHIVIPQDEKVVSTQVFYELARMGRHVRTGLIVASQSPQDLNTSVLKRLQTRFIFALEKDQLQSIKAVLSDFDDNLLNQLPKLPRGVCAVSGTGEVVKHGFVLRVRKRQTPVKGGTPPVFSTRTKKQNG
jgi:hypothetical protein